MRRRAVRGNEVTDRQHRAQRAQSTKTGTRSTQAPAKRSRTGGRSAAGGGTWALHTPRWLRKHPRAAETPGRGPSPARGRPVTFAPGSATESSRGASTSGAGEGGSLGLGGGAPPPPLPGGAGAQARWEVPGAAAAPRPSRRPGAGRAAAPPGRGGGARAGLSLPAPPRGSGAEAGGPRAGGEGATGRCFRGSRPLLRPAPSPRPPSRASLASCRRPLPWRRCSRASAL